MEAEHDGRASEIGEASNRLAQWAAARSGCTLAVFPRVGEGCGRAASSFCPLGMADDRCRLGHRGDGSPYAAPYPDDARYPVLVSATDEGELSILACALPREGSSLVGIGIDLAPIRDFGESARGEHVSRLLLTPHERSMAERRGQCAPAYARAACFAAKEAAFKACSDRRNRLFNDEALRPVYEVGEFEMVSPGRMRGTARRGRAQEAMDLMGICEIAVRDVSLGDFACVLALAFADKPHSV